MGTSGTIAKTLIDNSKLMEHAFRRCKVLPSAQTPETVMIANECLYMLLLNMGNRGLNLWCVDKVFVGFVVGQETYPFPAGTLDLLDAIYSRPTISASTFSAPGHAVPTTVGGVQRIGFKVAAPYDGVIVISGDGVALLTLPSSSYVPGVYYWADLPVIAASTFYDITGTVLTDIKLASEIYDLPLSPWNRSTYLAQSNKRRTGSTQTNYFYEKKLTPQITLWPVPDSDINHLTAYVHRQPQDVGSLTQQIEIPQRWLDGFIWLLSQRLSFELPNIDPAVAQMVNAMAEQQTFEMEGSESDGMPTYLTPAIACYTR